MKFYVTYGSNHETASGMSLANYYTPIEAESYGEARLAIRLSRNDKWAFMYGEEDFSGQPEKYNLEPISLFEVSL